MSKKKTTIWSQNSERESRTEKALEHELQNISITQGPEAPPAVRRAVRIQDPE